MHDDGTPIANDPCEKKIGRGFKPCRKCPHYPPSYRRVSGSRMKNKTPVRTRLCRTCGKRFRREEMNRAGIGLICKPCDENW